MKIGRLYALRLILIVPASEGLTATRTCLWLTHRGRWQELPFGNDASHDHLQPSHASTDLCKAASVA